MGSSTERNGIRFGRGNPKINKVWSGAFVFDFPNIAANSTQTTTVSLPGVVTGATNQQVMVTSSDAAQNRDIHFKGFVSANNVVTICATNPTVGAIDPASATYRVTVMQIIT